MSIYPILDIFQNENVVPNETIFYEKLENYVSFIGENKPIVAPNEALNIYSKNI